MREYIAKLKELDELTVIEEPVDIDLEIAHIAYAEVKKPNGGKALLFTNPKSGDKIYKDPVLINLYGSKKRTELMFEKPVEEVANDLQELLHLAPPKTIKEKIQKAIKLFRLKAVFPKRIKDNAFVQEVVYKGDEIDLNNLPVLKTWQNDGGRFITMGQTYTQSIDKKLNNVGMYRLQVFDKNTLGMHWQIHKDASNFFAQYEEANKPMPIAIAIGGDPLYTWCATAPLPKGIFELMLYGFVKNRPAKMIKCLTNDLYVPHDADYVIEGYIESPKQRKIEGPFGDHTGYYTLEEPYPFMKVTAITTRKNPIFLATVVGKPPIEDKYMGWPTERIFLPLLRTTVPELIDYRMPENGVFHNLIIAKINTLYKAHAIQAMHSFWGVGQMSFVKNAIFVNKDAGDITDDQQIFEYILDRFDPKKLLITTGVLDALDHSSDEALVGGKMGIDCTGEKIAKTVQIVSDRELLEKMQKLTKEVIDLKQYGTNTANPITVIKVAKTRSVRDLYKEFITLSDHLRIVIAIDDNYNDVNNPYMTIWRVSNNFDALRDLVLEPFVYIDATNKGKVDGFDRRWPEDTNCTKSVLEDLKKRGLFDFDDQFIAKWQL